MKHIRDQSQTGSIAEYLVSCAHQSCKLMRNLVDLMVMPDMCTNRIFFFLAILLSQQTIRNACLCGFILMFQCFNNQFSFALFFNYSTVWRLFSKLKRILRKSLEALWLALLCVCLFVSWKDNGLKQRLNSWLHSNLSRHSWLSSWESNQKKYILSTNRNRHWDR